MASASGLRWALGSQLGSVQLRPIKPILWQAGNWAGRCGWRQDFASPLERGRPTADVITAVPDNMEGDDGGVAVAGHGTLSSRAAAATVREILQDGKKLGWVGSWG